jgi:hypothetical protein
VRSRSSSPTSTRRDRTSHEIALEARELLTPLAREAGARITVVEMPPGPPVLQAVVAEIYGPDGRDPPPGGRGHDPADRGGGQPGGRGQLHAGAPQGPALRGGRGEGGAPRDLGGHRDPQPGHGPGRVQGRRRQARQPAGAHLHHHRGAARGARPTCPGSRTCRSPPDGRDRAAGGAGSLRQGPQDPIVYHKDLRPLEYVVGDAVGKLGAPLYPHAGWRSCSRTTRPRTG